MPFRKKPIVPDKIYHIYNRGVDKRPIFLNKNDWEFFYAKMRDYFKPEHASLLAFCLMPNHYHLIVLTHSKEFSLKVMQPFMLSFVKRINKKYQRAGTLFQGPFQSKVVESEGSLLQLSRYIHLNPVKAKLVDKPEDWEYSSYRDYIGYRKNNFIRTDIILSLMGNPELYQKFVLENQLL